jgi:nitrous oxidase accessory protein NosD
MGGFFRLEIMGEAMLKNILLALLVIMISSPVHAITRYVPDDRPTIQDGVDSCSEGDTVIVRAGTYVENVDFNGVDIVLRSENGPEVTIIDGNQEGSVVKFNDGETQNTVLEGFTLTNGSGTHSYPDYNGGGIYCWLDSSPTITNNIITGNSCYRGGGIWCYSSTPVITDNIISNNSTSYGGGGISCLHSNATISGNVISGNSAYHGGGIHCDNSSPLIMNNTIVDNILVSVSASGGGIYLRVESDPSISNNIISRNTSLEELASGGGIYSWSDCSPTIVNNTISENSVGESGSGGGIYCTGSGSSPVISNSIFWGNEASAGPEMFVGMSCSLTINYSDVEGGEDSVEVIGTLNWGLDMINEDPLYAGDFYHLMPGSPCIDTGDTALVDGCRPPGRGGIRSDMGVYGGEANCSWLEAPIDLIMYPTGPDSVARGDTLFFEVEIWNSLNEIVVGNYWLVVRLPNSNEILIPEGLMNYPNPFSGQIAANGTVSLSNELYIPVGATLSTFSIVGRVGLYPNVIIDEEEIDLHVIE